MPAKPKKVGTATVKIKAECGTCSATISFNLTKFDQTIKEALNEKSWSQRFPSGWQCPQHSGLMPGRVMRSDRAM